MTSRFRAVCVAVWLLSFPHAALAQDGDVSPGVAAGEIPPEPSSSAELAKQLANPVSSLISVPFQHNYDCCYGPADGARYQLNVQPVVPLSLSPKWNLIVRTIMPVVVQGESVTSQGSAAGLGDITQSFFFSPKASKSGLIWAVGPVIVYPIGDSLIGSEKWSAGPTALVLKQAKAGVTVGILANHVWSFAGDSARDDVSATFLQPFFAKTLPDSTTFSLNSESTYNWKTKDWVVPVNFGVTHVVRIGKQRVQMGPQARYYLTSPDGGPTWGARFTVTLLFPKH